jgi:hypothetical protein
MSKTLADHLREVAKWEYWEQRPEEVRNSLKAAARKIVRLTRQRGEKKSRVEAEYNELPEVAR